MRILKNNWQEDGEKTSRPCQSEEENIEYMLWDWEKHTLKVKYIDVCVVVLDEPPFWKKLSGKEKENSNLR